MADIRFLCPHCGQNIVASEQHRGHRVRCPVCKGRFFLPALQSDAGSVGADAPCTEQPAQKRHAADGFPRRPWTVKTALALLGAYAGFLGLGVVILFLAMRYEGWTPYIDFFQMAAYAWRVPVALLLVALLSVGHGWARILFVIFCAVGGVLSVTILKSPMWTQYGPSVMSEIAMDAMQLGALICLFLPRSSDWFKRVKRRVDQVGAAARAGGSAAAALPAEVWRRVVALLLDLFILDLTVLRGSILKWVMWMFFEAVPMALSGSGLKWISHTSGSAYLFVWTLYFVMPTAFLLLVGWLYFALLEASYLQGTLGKKLMRIRVQDLQGQRLSFGVASRRFFAKLLSVATFGVGFLMVLRSPRKQTLHDRVAGCRVVKV